MWLCSRNDAIGNVAVMGAALAVWGTTSAWPDLAVAGIMAGLFLTSSSQILLQAWREYRNETEARTVPLVDDTENCLHAGTGAESPEKATG